MALTQAIQAISDSQLNAFEQRVARQIRVRNPIPVCKFTLFLGCWSPRPSS